MIRVVAFLSIICFLIACEPGNIEELPMVHPKLAVFGDPEPGSPWLVSVSHTIPMFTRTFGPEGVSDATVKIFEGDQLIEQLTCDCHFNDTVSKFKGITNGPVIGHTYRVEVAAGGYETATAHYTQPPIVEIEDFTFEITGIQRSDPNSYIYSVSKTVAIEVTFTDPPGENYYNIALTSRSRKDPSKEDSGFIFLHSDLFEYQTSETQQGQFIDDKNFEGKRVTLKFSTQLRANIFLPLPGQDPAKRDTFATPYLTFSLRNVAKELHEYNRFATSKVTFAPDAEPYLYSTNIENGIGIFAGFSASKRELEYGPF